MTAVLARRAVVGGLAALAADAALTAPRPTPRPSRGGAALAAGAGLSGVVGFVVQDVASGAVLEALNPDAMLAPASVAKIPTALFALARLGPDHRFTTILRAVDGVNAEGVAPALALVGGGDPTLDSDALLAMARDAAATLRSAPGGVAAAPGASLPRIDDDQSPRAAYNPAVAALNLNFNRVRLRWRRRGARVEAGLVAQAKGWSPPVSAIALRLAPADCGCPAVAFTPGPDADGWTVRESALAGEGSLWLPVRRPDRYAADVMAAALRQAGVVVGDAAAVGGDGPVLARHDSPPLHRMVDAMLRYSNNLTAEALGLAATGMPASDLSAAAQAMNGWAAARSGAVGFALENFSGLTARSAMSPRATAALLRAAAQAPALADPAGLLRPHAIDEAGAPAPSQAEVRAKTGTLDFVRALAGLARTPSGRLLAFAYAANDLPRRAATRGGPPRGARAWRNRAARLERALLRRWLTAFD